MSLVLLLSRLKELEINIDLLDGQLKIEAPKGKLTPGLVDELREKKGEIIEFLQRHVKGREVYASIGLVEEKEYYVLSSVQKRLYILYQLDKGGIGYNMPCSLELDGSLDKERLADTFKQLVQRHESFRTSFEVIDEEPVQMIHEHVEFSMEQGTLHRGPGLPEIVKDFIRPFDLSQAPLLRVGLVDISENKYLLMVDMHHIIADGVSIDILINDFVVLYGGKELCPLKLRYRDYTEWQHTKKVKEEIQKHEAYWLKAFEGEVPVLDLPTDWARPAIQSFEGAEIGFYLSKEEKQALNQLAQSEGATLFMVLLAMYHVFLSKISGQEDIVVGSPVAGRPHADLEWIIGMFVNTLALRNNLSPNSTFSEFLKEVKANTLAVFEHQDYQFEELVDILSIVRDTSRNPLFDVVFSLQNVGIVDLEILEGLQLRIVDKESTAAKFDLTFKVMEEKNETLSCVLEYCTKLFKKETVERLSRIFQKIISFILKNPLQQLQDIEIIDDEKKKQILEVFNNTGTDYPAEKTIHRLFEEQVSKMPFHTAVVFENESITYKELEQRANGLAVELHAKGVSREAPVGILARHSLEMIIAVLGILKAGAAYLPLDPGYPRERIQYMLKDSNARVLVSKVSEVSEVSGNIEVIDLSNVIDKNVGPSAHPNPPTHLTHLTHPTHLSYIIYTSGSTGQPKGVMVEHRNVVRLVKNTNYVEFKEGDRVLQTGALEFDASTFEIWGSLLNGLSLHLVRKNCILNPALLKEAINKYGISTIWMTAPLFNRMLDADSEIFGGLENLLVGGDVLSVVHINRLRERFPHIKVINGYGPTENTTFSTTFWIDKEYGDSIPIGSPIANSTAFILDKHYNLQPIGIVGELWVGGDGVSRGYMNNPDLTTERFIDISKSFCGVQGRFFQKEPLAAGGTFYKTGDLARWLPDGNIEFLGRKDFQVKIRGFRIELGEIETQLLNKEEIKEAVVIAKENQQGEKYLAAYIVLHSAHAANAVDTALFGALKDYLSRFLPDYMVPAYFVQLEEIPLTSNGKVDRRALPDPEIKAEETYIAPRDQVEEKLAEIWAEVLGLDKDKISIDADFFQLGGHSLKAAALLSKMHKELDAKVDLVEIFKNPTIRGISSLIDIIYWASGQRKNRDQESEELVL